MKTEPEVPLDTEPEKGRKSQNISDLEQNIIDYFVHIFRLFNLPRSVAEIYGLLFASPEPLNMDEIIHRLGMSKGAVSQGLKLLKTYGALELAYRPGERRDYYKVQLEMRKIASGFLKEQLVPHLEGAAVRLNSLEQCPLEGTPDHCRVLAERINSLKTWQGKGQELIPGLLRFLQS